MNEKPMEFHAEEIKSQHRTDSSSLEFELTGTKHHSATNACNVKFNDQYLSDVEKYLKKSPHLMCFKTKHTKPINSIVSELQRMILKKMDSNFDHHENLL